MANPFVAEIRIFGFNFAPLGWAFCDGQLLPISQNAALFSLVGTYYGGNGTSTFGLPNFQGIAPMHPGQGPGLSLYELGETGGTTTVTVLQSEMPSHNHPLEVKSAPPPAANSIPSTSDVFGRSNGGAAYANAADFTAMSPSAVAPNGGNLPHNNLMPYLTLNFCIALQGVYPARN